MSKGQSTTKKVNFASEVTLSMTEALKYSVNIDMTGTEQQQNPCDVAGWAWQRASLAGSWWEVTLYNRLHITGSSAAEFYFKHANRDWTFSFQKLLVRPEGKSRSKGRQLPLKTNVKTATAQSTEPSFAVLRPKPEKAWEPWVNYLLGNEGLFLVLSTAYRIMISVYVASLFFFPAQFSYLSNVFYRAVVTQVV